MVIVELYSKYILTVQLLFYIINLLDKIVFSAIVETSSHLFVEPLSKGLFRFAKIKTLSSYHDLLLTFQLPP